MKPFFARLLLLTLSGTLFFTQCKARSAKSSASLKAFTPKEYKGLSTDAMKILIKKAQETPITLEINMAWMTLANNYLKHLDAALDSFSRLPTQEKTSSLALNSDEERQLGIDEQRVAIEAARSQAQSALDQQRLMLEYGKASDEYTLRNNDFFKGMDQQKFDQGIKASTTAVENQGKAIENQGKIIENIKKGIEAEILKSYSVAYNSYVRAFQEYSSNMTSVMKGATKVSKQVAILASSFIEYSKRVDKCSNPLNQVLKEDLQQAIKNEKTAKYSDATVNNEAELKPKMQAIFDKPSGEACLEFGMIQANIDAFKSSTATDSYILTHPLFKLSVMTKFIFSEKLRNEYQVLTACPSVNTANSLQKNEKVVTQVDTFTEKLAGVVKSLKEVQPDSSDKSKDSGSQDSGTTLGKAYEAADLVDFSVAEPIDAGPQGTENEKVLLVPYPATPYQTLKLVSSSNLAFRLPVSSKDPPVPYCALIPSNQKDKGRLVSYVQAVRDFENFRLEKLRTLLELDGVKFEPNGQIVQIGPAYTAGSLSSDHFGRFNSIMRRGFYYAQQCALHAEAHAVAAGLALAKKSAVLPTATDVSIGSNKYSFFYPPYSLGEDSNTRSDIAVATRRCVDSALLSLSQKQQALGAATEYSNYFKNAADIKAPAAPIPYVPNPQPGSIIYTR